MPGIGISLPALGTSLLLGHFLCVGGKFFHWPK